MVTQTGLPGFALLALGMVLVPGPNMMYLVSRSLCQGRRAGLVSLGGVGVAFLVYVLATSLGITALLFAVPIAYDVLRLAGALYLLYLAWNVLKPGGRLSFQVSGLQPYSDRKLFVMGFLTNLLNPKAALLYLSLLPQFIDPARGSVFAQAVMLGVLQIAISMTVNACIVLLASRAAGFFDKQRAWIRAQRLVLGGVLAGLALRLLLDTRR